MWCKFDHVKGCLSNRPRAPGLGRDCWAVADRLVAMPSTVFKFMHRNNISLNHETYKNLVNANHFVDRLADLKFWITSRHDTDTEEDWNPFYTIAGRPSSIKDTECSPFLIKNDSFKATRAKDDSLKASRMRYERLKNYKMKNASVRNFSFLAGARRRRKEGGFGGRALGK